MGDIKWVAISRKLKKNKWQKEKEQREKHYIEIYTTK